MTTFIADYIFGTRRRSRPAGSSQGLSVFKSRGPTEGLPHGAFGPAVPPDQTHAKTVEPSDNNSDRATERSAKLR
jgi:hypothetical protein